MIVIHETLTATVTIRVDGGNDLAAALFLHRLATRPTLLARLLEGVLNDVYRETRIDENGCTAGPPFAVLLEKSEAAD